MNKAMRAAGDFVWDRMCEVPLNEEQLFLDEDDFLFLQMVALRDDWSAPIFPWLQAEYGDNRGLLYADLRETLKVRERLRIAPALPIKDGGLYRAVFTRCDAPPEKTVVFNAAGYVTFEQLVPPELMRRLADYALNYISGSGFVPIEEVNHTIEGALEVWQKLREQALNS